MSFESMDQLLSEFGMTDDEAIDLESNFVVCDRCGELYRRSDGQEGFCGACAALYIPDNDEDWY